MPLIPLLVAGLIALAILMVFVGFSRRAQTSSPVEERLQMYGTRPRTLEEIELQQPFTERAVLPLIRGLARLFRVSPHNET